jgi:hypothetical protein
MLGWATRLDAIEAGTTPDPTWADRLLAAAEAAGYRVDALRTALATAPVKKARQADRPPSASRSRKRRGTA